MGAICALLVLDGALAWAKLETAKSAVVVRHKDRTGKINAGLSVTLGMFLNLFLENRTGNGLFRKETILGTICFYGIVVVFLCFILWIKNET